MIMDKIKKIDHYESLPFRKRSTNGSQIQHQLSSNSYHYDAKSNKSSNRSSSRDSMRLPIHHKHKHKSVYNHHTTTSFDTPSSSSLSSNTFVPTKEFIQKYRQTSVKDNSLNSTNTKPIKSVDKAAKHYQQIETPSVESSLHNAELSCSNNQNQVSCLRNEFELNKHSTVDNYQLSSSKDLNKPNILLNNNQVPLNPNLFSKNITINHYPNMLADFD
ncbi:unnamed protein product [Rotaria sp. Silwood2]|nr:unnamed protein product [Rotaria sp. Silwood2]CAF4019284.1 unnamed protein product [Rotaria sp. Silwood2]